MASLLAVTLHLGEALRSALQGTMKVEQGRSQESICKVPPGTQDPGKGLRAITCLNHSDISALQRRQEAFCSRTSLGYLMQRYRQHFL